MKKIMYVVAVCFGLGVLYSCDSEPKNPGDYNVKPTLELGDVVSIGTPQQHPENAGAVYEIRIAREIDTIFQHRYLVYDTLKNADGEPILDELGKMKITADTFYYPSKFTARYYESEVVTLPSDADTFRIEVNSNARWFAPVPDNKKLTQWFFNYNSTLKGNGDSKLEFYVNRNRTNIRKNMAEQLIFSEDSTVMYNIRFVQKGERDK